MSLTTLLSQICAEAFAACGLPPELGQVVLSNRPDLGQFQGNGALAAAQQQGRNPRQLAQAVADVLIGQEIFAEVTVAGPGFINLSLTNRFLAAHSQALAEDERLGCPAITPAQTIVIDFGGPNVAKPMHVGHLRSAVLGDCLQRLGRFVGHRVISDIHLGDWGTQMGMLINEVKQAQPDLTYFDETFSGPYPAESPVSITDLQTLYPQATARCQADPQAMAEALAATVQLQQGRSGYRALWQHFVAVSVAELKADFDSLGVKFDLWLGESDYHDRIPPLLTRLEAAKLTQLSEGALVMPLAPVAGRELPPLILVKSDGGYLYGTTDLATIAQRVVEFQADQILYVVDARQQLHFAQLFQAAQQVGLLEKSTCQHLGFGTVNGPDGKPFKTRAGGVMRLRDLLALVVEAARRRMIETGLAVDYSHSEQTDIAEKVGLAALKYADLMNHRTSDYVFDVDKFTRFEGRTGPYLLYTVVRIKSILRKAAEQGRYPGLILPPGDDERALMLTLAQLPEAVQSATEGWLPHHLGDFAYGLAQAFNRFYDRCHILSQANSALQASWLGLAHLCLAEFELVLSLLGIEVPERM